MCINAHNERCQEKYTSFCALRLSRGLREDTSVVATRTLERGSSFPLVAGALIHIHVTTLGWVDPWGVREGARACLAGTRLPGPIHGVKSENPGPIHASNSEKRGLRSEILQ